MLNPERRDSVRRAAFVERIVSRVVQGPATYFTVEAMQDVLEVSPDIAWRVLRRLSEAGVLRETFRGVWVKVMPAHLPIPGML
jgi:predicted transcriptional regulator of viral defense system